MNLLKKKLQIKHSKSFLSNYIKYQFFRRSHTISNCSGFLKSNVNQRTGSSDIIDPSSFWELLSVGQSLMENFLLVCMPFKGSLSLLGDSLPDASKRIFHMEHKLASCSLLKKKLFWFYSRVHGYWSYVQIFFNLLPRYIPFPSPCSI